MKECIYDNGNTPISNHTVCKPINDSRLIYRHSSFCKLTSDEDIYSDPTS